MNQTVHEVLSQISHEEYQALLEDAAVILEAGSPDKAELLRQVKQEAADAEEYLQMCNEGDWRPEIVDTLAAQITEGLTSDLDKALAIERYFEDEGYIYDLEYTQAGYETVEPFLLESHRGICYDYATAMTLLCRSAGLSARFVEGFNLFEPNRTHLRFNDGDEWDTTHVIRARDAHAFPEVYISGYGWKSFEPTVSSEDDGDDNTAENLNVMRWGFVMLGIAGIVLVIWLLMPAIREKLFRRNLRKLSAREAASAIFRRMRTTLHLPDSTTVNELAAASAPFFEEQALYEILDMRLYSAEEDTAGSGDAAGSYIRWQEAHKLYVKEQKRLAREQKKAARAARKKK